MYTYLNNRHIRQVIMFIIVLHYVFPLFYGFQKTLDSKSYNPAWEQVKGESLSQTDTDHEEQNAFEALFLILKKKRAVLSSQSPNDFINFIDSSAVLTSLDDLRSPDYTFDFTHSRQYHIKTEVMYLGLFAGISPPLS